MSDLIEKILFGLNENQKKAVCSDPNGQLQIIAGPGTGKTRVLISRVAYLLLKHNIPPENIIVTTFTKKAANEMMERLNGILGDSHINLNRLIIGTFHSICFRVLRIYGHKIGLSDFKIADERDSNQVLNKILSEIPHDLHQLRLQRTGHSNLTTDNTNIANKYNGYDPKKVKREISKLKSKALLPDQYANKSSFDRELACIYRTYQEQLFAANVLDFDDCLLQCYVLLKKVDCLNFAKHVLVDEFQDTNKIQLQLMYLFASGGGDNVTVVGDPDQSIYGFRDAVVTNFRHMRKHYTQCEQINLVENYRSTTDVLKLSEQLMRQQSDRDHRELRSQQIESFPPVHKTLDSNANEAQYIAQQIAYLKQLPELFNLSDISILVRAAYQTRLIERELVKLRIPYLMVKGRAFWDRKEVVAILDYLRIVASDYDKLAFLRTINYPKRSIGEKTLDIIERKINQKKSAMIALKEVIDELKPKQREAIKSYIQFIEDARYFVTRRNSSSERDNLIHLFDFVYKMSGLQKEFVEDKDMELNIMEVKNQLTEFEPINEELPLYSGGEESDLSEDARSLLEKFIASVDLYESDAKKAEEEEEDESKKMGKVSISTIHASKGLEWPVVFIPGLSEKVLPAGFALNGSSDEKAVDEERRIFYVATTRARLLLYITSYVEKDNGGSFWKGNVDQESRFLAPIKKQLKTKQVAFKDSKSLKTLYKLTGKKCPKSVDFDAFCLSYNNGKYLYSIDNSLSTPSSRTSFKSNKAFPTGTSGFTTARHLKQSTKDDQNKENIQTPSFSGFTTARATLNDLKRHGDKSKAEPKKKRTK